MGIDEVDPEWRIINKLTKCDFNAAETLLGQSESGDVGGGFNQADDFAVPTLRHEAALQEHRLASPVDRLELAFHRLAGEALREVAPDGREGRGADHLRDSFADDLIAQNCPSLIGRGSSHGGSVP
jgi:hypothetical protein